jgi:3-methyladenine DNA glycosylase Mpg
MAMGISLQENRLDLLGDRLFIEDRGIVVRAVDWSPRIGIRVGTDREWRASVRGHRAVSGQRFAPRLTSSVEASTS